MKISITSIRCLILFLFFSIHGNSQIDNSGCVIGNFGIDADLYSGALPFGNHSPATPFGTDDWFAGTSGSGVINVSNAAAIQSSLQGTADVAFANRMNGLFGTVVNGRTWFDAVYARDNFGGTGFVDPTAFPVSSKNSMPPSSWSAGPANVLGKNDLLDVAAHLRRNGTAQNSPLILNALIARAEPGGAAYMDMEFFIENVKYIAGTGFTYSGPDLGHTAFRFDGAGNLIKMGDMLLNISLSNGGTEAGLEIRIWVRRADRMSVTPVGFSWGPNYDGPSPSSEFVYASIIPLTTGNACGYVNVVGQLPTAPPWGHRGTKDNAFVTSFSEYSLAEFGINLTAFGLDPAFLPNYNPCKYPHKSFCVKTRSSEAFTAALKDFSGPYEWCQTNQVITTGGPLSCLNTTTTLSATPSRTDVIYQWSTTNGNIISGANTATITVNQPGDYLLIVTLPNGCQLDPSSFTVTYDPTKPFFNTTNVSTTLSCSGSNGAINITPSGGTTPFTFSWTGPNGFTATTEDLTNLAPGTYNVTISDVNGCSTTATAIVGAGTPIVFNPSITNVSCAGRRDGAISINPTGATPFTFSWSNGQTVQNLQNIGFGSYTVTATDANGCIWTATYTITQPSTLTSSLVKIDDTDADVNIGNGSIDLTVSGGTFPYTYSWTGPNGFTATTQDLTALKYGRYDVVITDANGCSITNSVFIFEPEICGDGIDNNGNGFTDCNDPICKPTNPSPIVPSVNPPCLGQTVTMTIINNPSYTYNWTVPSGSTIISGQGTNQITMVFNSLQGGNVCVRANNSGCLSEAVCILISPIDAPVRPIPVNIINN